MDTGELVHVAFAESGGFATCVLCGAKIARGEVGLSLTSAAPMGGRYGFICCLGCASRGPSAAAARGLEMVRAMRWDADNREQLCQRLPSVRGWPSADDLERFWLELDAERRAGVMAEADDEPVPF
jgi:hypothetical protein